MTISALKQCGRLFLPQILIKPPLVEWQKIEGSLFYGDVQGTAPLAGPFLDRVFFIIGPEKGLASTEIERAVRRNPAPSGAGLDELSNGGRKASPDASPPYPSKNPLPVQGGVIQKLQTLGAKAISLHENTLRTETAAITALSQFYSISSLS